MAESLLHVHIKLQKVTRSRPFLDIEQDNEEMKKQSPRPTFVCRFTEKEPAEKLKTLAPPVM